MTAPSLVLFGDGSGEPRSIEVSHALRASLLALRPELDVHIAFLQHNPPTGLQVARTLAKKGVQEAVFVPLVLSEAFVSDEVAPVLGQIRSTYPNLAVTASRPIGPETSLLPVLDRRLREALRERRVCELDGLVFACAGSPDVRSNALVARRARQWANHHKLPCVTAFGRTSGPTTAEAVRTLRAEGRRHIAVGSWFAAPGASYLRSVEQAHDAGAIAVSTSLGAEPEVVEAILTRYVVAAMDLIDLEPLVADVEPSPVRHLSVVGA
ncbi:MAG: sirohydrochlorin chelatase [Propionibacteriaceae bacterium]